VSDTRVRRWSRTGTKGKRETASFGDRLSVDPLRDGSPPGAVRTLDDMSRAEKRAIEKAYGMKILPKRERQRPRQ
jgi:hypothetical protein